MSSSLLPIKLEQGWQAQLSNVVTSPQQLLAMLGLSEDDVYYSAAASAEFSLKVPRSFVERMEYGNPTDPLLMQVLSSELELEPAPGYDTDPVGEDGDKNPIPGILHKYHGRALLIVSGGCAINCRYCFRRHFPYAENQNSRQEWQEALRYIVQDSSIEEVILSGGDPLVATDSHLSELVAQISEVPHVKRLRIHSRLPVVLPARITDEFVAAVTRPGLKSIMVIHCNHANEIDHEVRRALAKLQDNKITLLNQAVLLAGINDSAEIQIDLNNALFAAGVIPYYLHMLDKVRGAAHFDVPDETAKNIQARVAASLPGYMVPKLVREISGASGKTGISFPA